MIPYAVWQTLAGGAGGLVRALVGIAKVKSLTPTPSNSNGSILRFLLLFRLLPDKWPDLL